jgi:hypothetical protein
LIAAVPVTRPDRRFRFLLAILFQGATDIITLFDTAFAVAANVPGVALWFDSCAFPAEFFSRHNTKVSPGNAVADVVYFRFRISHVKASSLKHPS